MLRILHIGGLTYWPGGGATGWDLWISSHHLSGHRLWRLSFLFCHRLLLKFGATSGPFVPFDFIASFLWAPPVATQFSVVWAPPVATLVISCHRIISVGTTCGDSVFFYVHQWRLFHVI